MPKLIPALLDEGTDRNQAMIRDPPLYLHKQTRELKKIVRPAGFYWVLCSYNTIHASCALSKINFFLFKVLFCPNPSQSVLLVILNCWNQGPSGGLLEGVGDPRVPGHLPCSLLFRPISQDSESEVRWPWRKKADPCPAVLRPG